MVNSERGGIGRNEFESSPRFNGEVTRDSVSLRDLPRRSIESLRERLHSKIYKGVSKRISMSDTALLKSRLSQGIKSTLSMRSVKSVLEKLGGPKRTMQVSKWSRKLYGSDKAVLEEQERIVNAKSFVIHPFSNFRLAWDTISAVIILSNIVFIPMNIAFSGDEEDSASRAFKITSDVWFITDILLNFRTGIQISSDDRTDFELEPKEIAKRYIRTWFFIDLLASFPFDSIIIHFLDNKRNRALRFLRMAKAVSLIKVARIPRLIRGIHHWEEVFNLQYDFAVSLLRFSYLVFIIFLVCHWNGCMQYMVPMFNDFPNDTWVKMRGLHLPNVTWGEAYAWSLLKSTSQMLCLGYSQIIPVGMIDLWTTIFSQVSGAIVFAIFIGNAINLMQEMDASKNAYKLKINQGKIFDEQQILKELSPVLRQEVIWHTTADLILSVPLFEEVSDDFVLELGEKLMFTVYLPGDHVVKEGTLAQHMFFISRGEVEIRSNLFANELSDGAHFGEACLFSSAMKRSANVVALTTVHIYLLHRSDYVQVLQRFPEDSDKINFSAQKIRERSSRYDFLKHSDSF